MSEPWHTLQQQILTCTAGDFDHLAMQVFQLQARYCQTYGQYLDALGVEPATVTQLSQIPFLPISAFKYNQVTCLPEDWQGTFTTFGSSGTTGATRSTHWVADLPFYLDLSTRLFEDTYGPLSEWIILAALPSYLERQDSSLVAMVGHFISLTAHELSGFFLHQNEELLAAVTAARTTGRGVMVWGVTFALLALAEIGEAQAQGNLGWHDVVVMETGGMKGRGPELIREQLHARLSAGLGTIAIHSEYGMTELLSQAYSTRAGVFTPSATLRVSTFDLYDPLSTVPVGQRGGINVIDLGNLYSCSFIQTQDMGRLLPYSDGVAPDFEVLGRIDNSEVRGCNLLLSL